MSLTLVKHRNNWISPRIFGKILNRFKACLFEPGEVVWQKKPEVKILWHCPFKERRKEKKRKWRRKVCLLQQINFAQTQMSLQSSPTYVTQVPSLTQPTRQLGYPLIHLAVSTPCTCPFFSTRDVLYTVIFNRRQQSFYTLWVPEYSKYRADIEHRWTNLTFKYLAMVSPPPECRMNFCGALLVYCRTTQLYMRHFGVNWIAGVAYFAIFFFHTYLSMVHFYIRIIHQLKISTSWRLYMYIYLTAWVLNSFVP